MRKAFGLVLFSFLLLLSLPGMAKATDTLIPPSFQSVVSIDGTSARLKPSQITFDNLGNMYLVGYFKGSNVNFNPAGSDLKSSNGDWDIFLTKYNVDGTYAWTKTWGGTGWDSGFSIVIDLDNNIYLGGLFMGTDVNFNPEGSDLKSSNGYFDIFLTKYNANGTYAWTKVWGATMGDDAIQSITIDSSGNLYMIGYFEGTDVNFNPEGSDIKNSNGNSDVFLTKYNANGTYAWTKTWGGEGYDYGNSIAFDSSDNLYMSGFFGDVDVNFNPEGSDLKSSNGTSDIFLTKHNANGTYAWTKTWGGIEEDVGYSIAVDSDNNIYLSGYFGDGEVNFNPEGSDLRSSNGGREIFLTRYNADGTYAWTKTWGGTGYDSVAWQKALHIDANNNIYVTGIFESSVDFDPGPETVIHTAPAGSYLHDVFVSAFNTSGELAWVKTFGSSAGYDEGISVISHGYDLYLTGYVSGSVDFNPGSTPSLFTPTGIYPGFIIKYSYPSPSPSPSSSPSPTSLANSNSGNSTQEEIVQIPYSDHGNKSGAILSPTKDSSPGEQKVAVVIEPETLKFNAFLSSIKQVPSDLASSLLHLTAKPNTVLTGGDLMGIKTRSGVAWQVGSIQKIFYKAYPPKNSNNEPPVIIPSLQDKPSIISLGYTDLDLVPPGDPTHPFKPSALKLAHSPDGITWSIMPSSTVDPENKTVAAIDKLGGYYMIVSGRSTLNLPSVYNKSL